MTRLIRDRLTPEMADCIDRCNACHEACLEVIDYSLRKGGRQAEPDHIELLEDCSEICRTAADFLVRGSPRHALTCSIAAEVSEECAIGCEAWPDDPILSQCARICRDCAESCRGMAFGELGPDPGEADRIGPEA